MSRRWPDVALTHLKQSVIDADDHLDAMWRRVDTRLGRGRPRHLAAYRGFADANGVELIGRVLAEAPQGGPRDDAGWWDNLLDTYPERTADLQNSTWGMLPYSNYSPFGFNGAYVYARAAYRW